MQYIFVIEKLIVKYFSVAQTVKHGASNNKIMGSILRECMNKLTDKMLKCNLGCYASVYHMLECKKKKDNKNIFHHLDSFIKFKVFKSISEFKAHITITYSILRINFSVIFTIICHATFLHAADKIDIINLNTIFDVHP